MERCALLAVDLGLKTGLAFFDRAGRVLAYRSQHFGSPDSLRRAARHLVRDLPHLECLVLEGGGTLADLWEHVATRAAVSVHHVSAERWRQLLLKPRDQRTGPVAKQRADTLARRVIEWSGAPRPTSLRHDAAEAILIGLWAAIELGWLPDLPAELRR